jgi:hypothetical protein
MAAKPRSPHSDKSPGTEPYGAYDPIPVPDAVEKNSETSWALFQELQAREQARYADTVPLTVPGAGAQAATAAARQQIRPAPVAAASALEKMLQECRRANRVCPAPEHWSRLRETLAARLGAGDEKALPPAWGAQEWERTTPLARRLAFRSFVEKSAELGVAGELLLGIRALREEDWHHMGE